MKKLITKTILYKAIAYYRLSKEDEDNKDKDESNSISNQRKLVNGFVDDSEDIELVGEEFDDGYTGTNFDRPGFQRALERLERGEANCIIVKDLSRLGRDYIETGKYIEQIFPAMGVRFIAIGDYVDTTLQSKSDDIIIPFKNLMNDYYCRELSNKQRRQFHVMRVNGEFVSGFASYGYFKDPEDKHKLIVDEYAADVVRMIFAKRMAGFSCQAIADYLNHLGVLSPAEYKKSLGFKYKTGFQTKKSCSWSAVAIKRILTNRIYLGDLEQGKRTTPNYKVKKVIYKDPSEWDVKENTHEAIISETIFQIVQKVNGRDTKAGKSQSAVYPLAGMLFCGDCHGSMTRRKVHRGKKDFYYYVCSTNKAGQGCTSHNTAVDAFEERVLHAIQLQIDLVVEMDALIQRMGVESIRNRKVKYLELTIAQKNEELEKIREYRTKLYENKIDGLLNEDEYALMRQNYTNRIEQTIKNIEDLEKEKDEVMRQSSVEHEWMALFIQNKNMTELTREIVVALIDRIEIFEDNSIVITFNYMDEVKHMKELLSVELMDTVTEKAV